MAGVRNSAPHLRACTSRCKTCIFPVSLPKITVKAFSHFDLRYNLRYFLPSSTQSGVSTLPASYKAFSPFYGVVHWNRTGTWSGKDGPFLPPFLQASALLRPSTEASLHLHIHCAHFCISPTLLAYYAYYIFSSVSFFFF